MNRPVPMMQIEGGRSQPLETELAVMRRLLPLEGARVLELGCGGAEKTRQLAESTGVGSIVAAEVDRAAHAKNLHIADLPRVTFKSYGAEAIEEADASFDIVVMFKSLHHVPVEQLDGALAEIHRVLRPDGLLYVSEPVFAGEFNEVLRLFHDESRVRREAFAALERAVASGSFELVEEHFFNNELRLESFEQFERGVINVTHTEHRLTPALHEEVRRRFESYRRDGGWRFLIPNRVDLLQRAEPV